MRTTVVIAILISALALGGGYIFYSLYFAPGVTFRDCPDCPQLVVVGGATFLMGSPVSEPDRGEDEGPQHTVTLHRFADRSTTRSSPSAG